MKSKEKLSKTKIKDFKTIIWDYYKTFGRTFLWRKTYNPYHIVVSEIMLQQTQTFRVAGKFEQFIESFPTFNDLSEASLRDILAAWQGLGYNRRAIALQKTAQKIVNEFDEKLPNKPEILLQFPGIGKATAASICAFAFNRPTIFIETNIRTVFIHFFFSNQIQVHDNEIIPLIEQAVDKQNPREWYYALMDYGVMLKSKFPNPNKKSKHYKVQSKFEGSNRQIRGAVLKILTQREAASFQDLISFIDREPERIKKILFDLQNEGFIKQYKNFYKIN